MTRYLVAISTSGVDDLRFFERVQVTEMTILKLFKPYDYDADPFLYEKWDCKSIYRSYKDFVVNVYAPSGDLEDASTSCNVFDENSGQNIKVADTTIIDLFYWDCNTDDIEEARGALNAEFALRFPDKEVEIR